MEVGKMIFLSKWVTYRFHVNLPGCRNPAASWVDFCYKVYRYTWISQRCIFCCVLVVFFFQKRHTCYRPRRYRKKVYHTYMMWELHIGMIIPPWMTGIPEINAYVGVSKNDGTPKSSILIGFSIINHPFWGTTILGNPHVNPLTIGQWVTRNPRQNIPGLWRCGVKSWNLVVRGCHSRPFPGEANSEAKERRKSLLGCPACTKLMKYNHYIRLDTSPK